MDNTNSLNRWYERIIPPGFLLPAAIAGTVIIIISAVLEYRSRQDDYFSLMEERARVFTETILSTTQSTLLAAEELEAETNRKLYSNLQLIEKIDRDRFLTETSLIDLIGISEFDEIRIYDRNSNMAASAYRTVEAPVSVNSTVIQSIMDQSKLNALYVLPDTISFETDYLAAIVKRNRGGVITGIVSSERVQKFRKLFGFGQILKNFAEGESVEYVVLENEYTKIAGFFQNYDLSSFSEDIFLLKASESDKIETRVLSYEQGDVFESIAPFMYDGEPLGVLRLGFSLSELEYISSRAQRRIFLLFGLMVVVGLVFVNFVLSQRHRKLLKADLENLNEYTNTILENLESGVITIDRFDRIKHVNRKASMILESEYSDIYDKSYRVFPDIFIQAVEDFRNNKTDKTGPFQYNPLGIGLNRWLSIRITELKEDNNGGSCILLVDDVTKQVQLEEQKRTNERLKAIRRLASSVAHEIRNPLNSIKLIVDLLRASYSPIENSEKHKKYFSTVMDEITRIDSIVEEFLRYSRPPVLKPEEIDLKNFFNEIKLLYQPRFEKEDVKFRLDIGTYPEYYGDPGQLRQVFVNLIENAIQAREGELSIVISAEIKKENYIISVMDTGYGIPETDIKNIFDLYYTTKKKGSGIGLSIVHQIISRHNGTIEAESELGKGTKFIIELPMKSELKKEN